MTLEGSQARQANLDFEPRTYNKLANHTVEHRPNSIERDAKFPESRALIWLHH